MEVLAEENNEDEAVETLQRIWFAEPELPAWPAEYAWKAAGRGLSRGTMETCARLASHSKRAVPHGRACHGLGIAEKESAAAALAHLDFRAPARGKCEPYWVWWIGLNGPTGIIARCCSGT